MTQPRATTVFYVLNFLRAMPERVVFDLYLVRDLHLSPLQLILVGTATNATIVVGEVPTGVVADTYGRKLSLIVGFVGVGAAYVGIGVTSTPWLVIAFAAGLGLASTFTSGAYEAWIVDEVGAANAGSIFLRGARVASAGILVGLAANVALGLVSLRGAVVAGGALEIACGLACIVVMPETGFRRRTHTHARELLATAATGVRFARARTVVLLLVATQFFAGFGAEALDRLPEAHVLRDVGIPGGIPAVFVFGGVAAAATLFGLLALGPLIRRADRGGTATVARMLVGFTAATIALQVAFALGRGFAVVVVAYVAALLTRSMVAPLYTTWLNEQITDSGVRATVLSFSGQAGAVGEATGGPAIGAIGNGFGIPAALTAGALFLLPALGLFGRALRHHGREPELAAL